VRRLDGKSGEEVVGSETRKTGLPASDLLAFQSEDGARLTARPSGTEPKIKFYLELVGQAKDPAAVAETRARLDTEARSLKAALMKELQLA
jgi:phosphomannomutase